jgi:uncharacterized protein YceK
MARFWSTTLGAAVTVLLGGCGTMANITLSGSPSGGGSMKMYGGVQRDLDIVHDCTTNPDHPKDNAEAICFAAAATVAAVDLPFSVVADTLTLPITIPVALVTQGRTDKPQESASGPAPDRTER